MINAKEAAELAANHKYIKASLQSADLFIRSAAENGETETEIQLCRSASQWAVDHVIQKLQAAGYDAEELPVPEMYEGEESTWSYWRYLRINWENPRKATSEE